MLSKKHGKRNAAANSSRCHHQHFKLFFFFNAPPQTDPHFSLDFALHHAAILYTSCILVGIFINSSVPIFFELFIETVYPVPEGITCGVVTFLQNLFTGLLLFFLSFYCTGESIKKGSL